MLPDGADDGEARAARDQLRGLAAEEAPGFGDVEVVSGDDPGRIILAEAGDADLLVLGVRGLGRHRKAFGPLALRIAQDAPSATILVSRRG